MIKVIVGYNKHKTIKAACAPGMLTKETIKEDVYDMLTSGLTVNVLEMEKCTIGERIDWQKTRIVKL